jgi:hypothetical protein
MTAALPAAEAEAVPTLPKTVLLVALEAETAAGLDDVQVSGTPVRTIPAVSVTEAFRVVEVPVFTTNWVPGLPTAARDMDCTGQVVNWSGWLLMPLTVAKNGSA